MLTSVLPSVVYYLHVERSTSVLGLRASAVLAQHGSTRLIVLEDRVVFGKAMLKCGR